MRFPIYLHKTDSDSYSGFAPDIDGCFFAGKTVDDTILDAAEAIHVHLETLADSNMPIPETKGIESYLQAEACQGGIWAFVDIDVSKYDGKAVKLNITLPQHLLTRIDRFVESHKEFSSRSGFLAELARRELAKA
ncbi:type II toxin-antitoxin system HicB family antitoxin [Pantoea latae]|jgi:predicted RNase H-like HicB family nuclease|uniref:HicB-like antitoxin of toxin-antitoxin system domain-containing protein n=1 Tax=Pantoea latae TaxID=1964541 RepID=A0A1V9DFW9_9GAMM|nr:type II toxin-antitoxin system HicB family antitoxin [Pantoea latae]OQP32771.1 hypothetical protein B2J69_13320 [Pantoea latae]